MTNRSNSSRRPIHPLVGVTIKWIFYLLLALAMLSFMTSGRSDRSKALPLMPFALAVAVFSDEIPAAVAGGFAGLLIDLAQDQVLGFTAFYLCLVCGLISALFRQFLRKNILNYFIACLIMQSAYLYLHYFFYYRIWEFEGYEIVLSARLVPSTLKTLLIAPVMFTLVWLTEKVTKSRKELEIEEEDERVDRV